MPLRCFHYAGCVVGRLGACPRGGLVSVGRAGIKWGLCVFSLGFSRTGGCLSQGWPRMAPSAPIRWATQEIRNPPPGPPTCRHLASRLQHPPNAHATIAAGKPSGSLQRPLGAGSGLSARARVAPARAAAGKRPFSSASFGNSTLSSSASSSHSCPSPRSPTPECARAGQLLRDSDLVRNRPSECGAQCGAPCGDGEANNFDDFGGQNRTIA
jgi:hypothetical protein